MTVLLPKNSGSLEVSFKQLFGGLTGTRAALYRRDMPTLVWCLEHMLSTIQEMYHDNGTAYPGTYSTPEEKVLDH